MPVIETQALIDAPVDKTFAVFTDFSNLPAILNQAQIIQFLSEQKTGLGTKWEQTPIDSKHGNINIHEVVELALKNPLLSLRSTKCPKKPSASPSLLKATKPSLNSHSMQKVQRSSQSSPPLYLRE